MRTVRSQGERAQAGWALGRKDNGCIAREFCMIKFQHLMFVLSPSFQRSVIAEPDPKGNLSHPALLLCLCLTVVCQPGYKILKLQPARRKPTTYHGHGDFPVRLSYYWWCFCNYYSCRGAHGMPWACALLGVVETLRQTLPERGDLQAMVPTTSSQGE